MSIARREFIRRSLAGMTVGALAGAAAPGAGAQEPKPPVEPFCFCVVADSHCAEKPKEGLEQHGDGVAKFLLCIEAMERMDEADRPDFVLLAGDVHPAALQGHEERLTFPIYAVAGNHESAREQRRLLRQVFNIGFERDGAESDYYSFVHKGMRFVAVCNAGAGGDHVGHFCSEAIVPSGQCEWLEAELAEPERTVVFAHIPPHPDGGDANMYINRNDSRWFRDLVERTRPEAMFFGHLHKATQEYRIGETRCYNLRSCAWNFEQAPLGFTHVRVTESGLDIREVETARYAS